MELGQNQLQIFVSLVIVVGAAFVALICDFLKRSNEQLRELTIELRVRREEEQRRAQLLVMTPAHRVAQAEARPPKPAHAPAKEKVAAQARAVDESRSAEPAPTRAPAQTAPSERIVRLPARPFGEPLVAASEPPARPERIPQPEPLSRPVATAQPKPAPAAVSAVTPVDERPSREFREVRRAAIERHRQELENMYKPATPATEPQPVPEPAEPAPTATLKSSVIDGSILARVAQLEGAHGAAGTLAGMEFTETEVVLEWTPERSRNTERPGGELIAIAGGRQAVPAPPSSDATLPAGFQDGYVLTRLIHSRKPVTGLVVSIGVQAGESRGEDVPESVNNLIRSLLGPDDFASRSGNDEYLLIYPRERGASAQRRLSQIAERLWDFQLRSLGSFAILFSWGGVEVQSESISEAIASASERMNQTRRGRKTVSIQKLQRKAV